MSVDVSARVWESEVFGCIGPADKSGRSAPTRTIRGKLIPLESSIAAEEWTWKTCLRFFISRKALLLERCAPASSAASRASTYARTHACCYCLFPQRRPSSSLLNCVREHQQHYLSRPICLSLTPAPAPSRADSCCPVSRWWERGASRSAIQLTELNHSLSRDHRPSCNYAHFLLSQTNEHTSFLTDMDGHRRTPNYVPYLTVSLSQSPILS